MPVAASTRASTGATATCSKMSAALTARGERGAIKGVRSTVNWPWDTLAKMASWALSMSRLLLGTPSVTARVGRASPG